MHNVIYTENKSIVALAAELCIWNRIRFFSMCAAGYTPGM